MERTRKQMRIAPRIILILKWVSLNHSSQEFSPDETSYMVTGVHDEIPCCSPGTSPGVQKKTLSASEPQLLSENTPATIEADEIWLALQKLGSNRSSANFKKKEQKIHAAKLITTTRPTFDRKSKKF